MSATIKVPTQFIAVDKFSHVIKGMSKNIKNMSSKGISSIKRFDHKVTGVFKKMGRLSQLAIGVGVGALFLSAIDDVKTYETNLVGVGKTTGIVGKELFQFGQDTINMSNSLRGIKTNKLLELGVVAGQLGITGRKNILNFSTTMAKLEKSTDIVGEEGASQIARLLNITGEGVGNVDKFGASLVALGNSTSATESNILSVASEVARSTAAYDLNSQQILGLSASLADLGVAPQAAGTAIGKTFMGIEKATISGGKKLKEYASVMGLSAAETKSLFASDKQASFNKLVQGLNKIKNEGGSVTKTMETLGLNGTIVNKGIMPLVKNFDKLVGKLKLANDEYKRNGALNEEFGTASATVQTALDDISSKFTNVLLKSTGMGSGLEFVRDMLFFVADNMETVVFYGSLLLGSFIGLKVITGIISGIELVTKLWTGAQWLLNIALNANPIGLIIIAIGALIGLVVWAIQKYDEWGAALLNFMGPLGWIINLFMSFRKHWDSIVDAFQTEGILGGLTRIGEVIMDSLLYPMEQLLRLVSDFPLIGNLAKNGMDLISEIRENHNLKIEGKLDNNKPIDSPEMNRSRESVAVQEAMIKSELNINLKDPGKVLESVTSSSDTNFPNITTTQGAF